MPDRPHLRVDPGVRFGDPCVRGVSVYDIAGMLTAGETVAVVADDYSLTRADVLLACWFLGRHGPLEWRERWGVRVGPLRSEGVGRRRLLPPRR